MFGRERRDSFYGDPAYNPFERPSMPLASLALDGILGSGVNNDSGESVDPVRGLGVPTAYRCISIIATVVASCTLNSVDKNGVETVWQPWQNLQSYTPYEIAELMVTHLAGWGNFYAFPALLNGRLIDLQPIYPGNVDVLRIKGQKIFRVRKQVPVDGSNPAPESPTGGSGAYRDYKEDEVFHIPFLGFDGLKGISPIMAAAQTVGTSIAADRLAARFHSRGQQLGGIVKVKVPLANQDQADAIKYQWRSSHSGVRNAGDVAVLDSETDFQPVTINPDSLQLLESRGWQMQEVARIFGVPLTMLSTNSTGYGDAIETQQVGFVTYTVRQYTDRIEQRVARWFLPRGTSAAFDLDGLMRGSMLERFQAYNTAIAGGWMTREEPRITENMPALPAKFGLDEPLVPQSVNGQINAPVLTAPGATPPLAPEPPEDPDDDSDSDSDSDSDNEKDSDNDD